MAKGRMRMAGVRGALLAALLASTVSAPAAPPRADAQARANAPVRCQGAGASATPSKVRKPTKADPAKTRDSGYGEAYYAARGIQDQIARTARDLDCDAPIDDAYGSRGMWEAVDGDPPKDADSDGKDDP